tara:strand:+ start:765 stop:1250 length:486 start_codon:yes stop_codon:yes gene_type:complete
MNQIETNIIEYVQQFPLEKIMIFFSEPYYHPVLLITLYLIIYKKYDSNYILLFYFLFCVILIYFLKVITDRNRPYFNNINIKKIDQHVLHSKSFPSGHAFTAWFLTYLVSKKLNTNIVYLYPLLVGFSRIYLGVHYPSDVLYGFLFGEIAMRVLNYSNMYG